MCSGGIFVSRLAVLNFIKATGLKTHHSCYYQKFICRFWGNAKMKLCIKFEDVNLTVGLLDLDIQQRPRLSQMLRGHTILATTLFTNRPSIPGMSILDNCQDKDETV